MPVNPVFCKKAVFLRKYWSLWVRNWSLGQGLLQNYGSYFKATWSSAIIAAIGPSIVVLGHWQYSSIQYIYIYIYIYINKLCVCVCVCVYIYIYIYIYIYVCVYVCVCMYVCISLFFADRDIYIYIYTNLFVVKRQGNTLINKHEH